MTIARRLLILVAVPLVVPRRRSGSSSADSSSSIEARSRFVAENQIGSLAALGNITRTFTEMRVNVRSALLPSDAGGVRSRRGRRSTRTGRSFERLLREFADNLVSDDRDRRLLNEFRNSSDAWIAGAEEVLALAAAGRRDEATTLLIGPMMEISRGLERGVGGVDRPQRNARPAAPAMRRIETIEESRRNIFLVLARRAHRLRGARVPHLPPDRPPDRRAGEPGSDDRRRRLHAGGAVRRASDDEIGGLARSIDVLKQGAAAMEEQRWVKSSAAKLTGALQGATSLAEFGERLLSGLVPMLGGGVAGFYLAESEPEGARSARASRRRLRPRDDRRRRRRRSLSAKAWSGSARAIARTGHPDRSAGRLPPDRLGSRPARRRPGSRRGRWSRRTRCSRSWSSRRSGCSPRPRAPSSKSCCRSRR